MEKKSWTTPELIVLVRSKPEEAVLSGCKMNPAKGPVNGQMDCYQQINIANFLVCLSPCIGLSCS